MKRLSIILVFLMSTGQLFSQIPTTGLIGWYPFNGNGEDSSLNGKHGTVYGATLSKDRFGNDNYCYLFDGVDDYISTNLFPPDGKNSRTINVWAKLLDSSSQMVMVNYGENTPHNIFEFSLGSGGSCMGVIVDPNGGNRVFNRPMDYGDWHMYTIIQDSTYSSDIKDCRVYVDGIPIHLTHVCWSGTNTINTVNTYPITIGKFISSSIRYFNGYMDDIRIYNRALNFNEVQALLIEENPKQGCKYYDTIQVYDTVHVIKYDTIAITVTDTLVINITKTNINPPVIISTVKIYPNPAKNLLNIDFGNYQNISGYKLAITTTQGQSLTSVLVTKQNEQMDISFLAKGVYYIRIIDNNSNVIENRKLILN